MFWKAIPWSWGTLWRDEWKGTELLAHQKARVAKQKCAQDGGVPEDTQDGGVPEDTCVSSLQDVCGSSLGKGE